MSPPELEILYEDNHLLAVSKPAGLATMGLSEGQTTLLSLAKDYIKRRYKKPGNVFLGVVSRLDAPVTGLVLLARTSKAAARLSAKFREHDVEKTYWALVEGIVEPAQAECRDWLAEDPRHRRMWVVGPTAPGAKEARLAYRRLGTLQKQTSFLEINLQTGRKHQIRLQLAERDHPVLGDRKYGSHRTWPSGIALHSHSLQFTHPVLGTTLKLVAPIPRSWTDFGFSEA